MNTNRLGAEVLNKSLATYEQKNSIVAVLVVVGGYLIILFSIGLAAYCVYKGYSFAEWGAMFKNYAVVKCIR